MPISGLNKLWHIHIKNNVVILTEVKGADGWNGMRAGRGIGEALLADPLGKGDLSHPHCSRMGLSFLACLRLCLGRT